MIFQPVLGAGSQDDFAHDDHGPQTALGLVVGGRDVGPAEAGEELLSLRAQEAFAEGLGFGVVQRLAANGAELAAQSVVHFFARPARQGRRVNCRWA